MLGDGKKKTAGQPTLTRSSGDQRRPCRVNRCLALQKRIKTEITLKVGQESGSSDQARFPKEASGIAGELACGVERKKRTRKLWRRTLIQLLGPQSKQSCPATTADTSRPGLKKMGQGQPTKIKRPRSRALDDQGVGSRRFIPREVPMLRADAAARDSQRCTPQAVSYGGSLLRTQPFHSRLARRSTRKRTGCPPLKDVPEPFSSAGPFPERWQLHHPSPQPPQRFHQVHCAGRSSAVRAK